MEENNKNNEPLNKDFKVPKLRFPEFKDEWNEAKLKSITSLPAYGLNSSSVKYDGENKYLRITDIDDETHAFNYSDLTSPARFTNEFLLQEGDLLFARTGASVGKTYLYNKTDGKVYYAGYLIKFHIELNKPKFVFYELQNQRFIKWVNIMSKRSGQPGINAEEYSSYKLFLPCKEEQNKLIKFFDLLELKIDILRSKIQTLKKYKEGIKKYVMKDTIKFWKTGIGNAIELKNYLFEKNEYCVKNGLYPHITLSTEGITDKSERYDRDFLVKNEDKKYKITHLNQLCYNPANLKFGVICINKYGNGIFSPIYSTFDINNIVIDYLELIITSNDFINYSMKYQQGTVFERMAVSSDDLCKIKIVTTSFDEQQKIAKVADTLNKKISKLEDELLNLKHLKSTLLNDMFI